MFFFPLFFCCLQSNKELQSVGGEVEVEEDDGNFSGGEEGGEEPYDSDEEEEEENSDLEADPHRQR